MTDRLRSLLTDAAAHTPNYADAEQAMSVVRRRRRRRQARAIPAAGGAGSGRHRNDPRATSTATGARPVPRCTTAPPPVSADAYPAPTWPHRRMFPPFPAGPVGHWRSAIYAPCACRRVPDPIRGAPPTAPSSRFPRRHVAGRRKGYSTSRRRALGGLYGGWWHRAARPSQRRGARASRRRARLLPDLGPGPPTAAGCCWSGTPTARSTTSRPSRRPPARRRAPADGKTPVAIGADGSVLYWAPAGVAPPHHRRRHVGRGRHPHRGATGPGTAASWHRVRASRRCASPRTVGSLG